jgi:hypothetical protein
MQGSDQEVLKNLLAEANRALVELPECGANEPVRVECPPALFAAWHTYARLLKYTESTAIPGEMGVGVRGVLERLRMRLKRFGELG